MHPNIDIIYYILVEDNVGLTLREQINIMIVFNNFSKYSPQLPNVFIWIFSETDYVSKSWTNMSIISVRFPGKMTFWTTSEHKKKKFVCVVTFLPQPEMKNITKYNRHNFELEKVAIKCVQKKIEKTFKMGKIANIAQKGKNLKKRVQTPKVCQVVLVGSDKF